AHAPGGRGGLRVHRHLRRPASLLRARRDVPGAWGGRRVGQSRQRDRVPELHLRGGTMRGSKSIVFVWLHGAAKSVLAAAEFQRLATEHGLDLVAEAFGTEPDPQIAPGVVNALRAEGLDLSARRPRRVTREATTAAARVVTFGCELGEATPA